jgi:hypothetical protein
MSDGRTEALRGTYFNSSSDPKDPFGDRFESHPSSADSKVVKKQQLPDAKKHQIISFIKSGVRILGYCFIPFSLVTATILLILSEVIGIIEELV